MLAALQHLHQQAEERPDHPALVTVDEAITFAQLHRMVAAVTRRLRDLGIAPRQLIATDLPPALDWIVTLALLRLATRSVSAAGAEVPPALAVDALLARPGAATRPAHRVVTIDRLWIDQVVDEALDADEPDNRVVLYPRADAVCRVILTSGTTGTPRGAELSVAAVEHRLAHLAQYWTDDRIELNLMPLSTTGGFHTALACLQHGTPYLVAERTDERTARLAADQQVQVLAGSPVQIGRLLQAVREHRIPLPALEEVRMAGAAPTPALLAAIADTFGVAVRSVYGSTEGGGVTTRQLRAGDDPADVGIPLASIRLEVVDERDAPLPPGETGAIRYRGAGLASGYGTPDAERSFRGGWFYPGDHGHLTPGGSLVLSGRESDLVNLGGVKVDPGAIDAEVDGFAGVIDAAAFVLERTPGVPELGLAVVAAPGADLRALDQHLRQRLPLRHPTVFGAVAAIPRNRMGKVERARLTAEFRRRLNLD